eukprot:4153782-Prymnesium_polylepis.1
MPQFAHPSARRPGILAPQPACGRTHATLARREHRSSHGAPAGTKEGGRCICRIRARGAAQQAGK